MKKGEEASYILAHKHTDTFIHTEYMYTNTNVSLFSWQKICQSITIKTYMHTQSLKPF